MIRTVLNDRRYESLTFSLLEVLRYRNVANSINEMSKVLLRSKSG